MELDFAEKPDILYLFHYGKGHLDGGHSGRFPWGSGDDPYQRAGEWMTRVNQLRKQGFTYYDKDTGKTLTGDTAIARSMELSTTEFRVAYALAKDEERMKLVNRAAALKDSGMGYTEIARKMGLKNESSVRSLLNGRSQMRTQQARATAELIKEKVNEKGMIQVGSGTERYLGITRNKLDEALYILEGEGYKLYGGRVPNPTDLSGSRQTTIKVIAPPDTKANAIYDYSKISSIEDFTSDDNGQTFRPRFTYPTSMDSSRLNIRYAEDGGKKKDGVIEIRRGVEDLSLGDSNYAQVRILVDDNRYLKGMAVYGDDSEFPKGVDVIFNTNKTKDVAKMDVLKKVKTTDKNENPFGASIKAEDQGGQYWYIDKNGEKKLGLINKRSDEGDWGEWKDKIPSQFLSKQNLSLAKRQLKLAIQQKKDEYQLIDSLTNATVKKRLLYSFAEDCDSAAVHLYAAALPRQKYQVILPATSISDTEVYAPNYNNGEKVALIRYPHGGTFEIPILTVNNNNKEAKNMIGTNSQDAIVINANVAERLSGADFDGDTVMVIPTGGSNGIDISSRNRLKDMEGFDLEAKYGTTEKYEKDTVNYKTAVSMRKEGKTDSEIAKELGKPYASKDISGLIKDGEAVYYNHAGEKIKTMTNTQNEMGKISNLITDMTIIGATDEELARAVKHSMVVIDAEKHHYDYKSSEKENGIAALKEKYQGRTNAGAATIISKAKSKYNVDKRQGSPTINIKGNANYDPSKPEGALIYKTADNDKLNYMTYKRPEDGRNVTVGSWDGDYWYNASTDPSKKEYVKIEEANYSKIKNKTRTQESTKMMETDDAYTLVSNYRAPMEILYADYANSLKAMANEARKEYATTKDIEYNPSAAKAYSNQVNSLKTKLAMSEKNAPREKQAMIIANARIQAKKDANPELKYNKKELLKLGQQELEKARGEVGASRTQIVIDDAEWEAIQAGAVSATTLGKILNHTDTDSIKEKATPRSKYGSITTTQVKRIKQLANQGYTNAQIAQMVGVSSSTVVKYINGEED